MSSFNEIVTGKPYTEVSDLINLSSISCSETIAKIYGLGARVPNTTFLYPSSSGSTGIAVMKSCQVYSFTGSSSNKPSNALYKCKNGKYYKSLSELPEYSITADNGVSGIYIPQFSIQYWIATSNGYVLYLEEQEYQNIDFYKTIGITCNPSTVEIYEPFVIDLEAKFSYQYLSVNSSGIISSGTAETKTMSGSKILTTFNFDNSWQEIEETQYTVAGDYTYTAQNEENELYVNNLTFTITCENFKEDYLEIREKSDSNYNIYVGKAIDEDFLTSFQVWRVLKNEYKTISVIKYSALVKDNMSNTIMSSSEGEFRFVYTVDDQSINYEVNKNIHKLSATPFINVFIKTQYQYGELLDINDINVKEQGALTYDDNTTILLSEIEYIENPTVSCSLLADDETSIVLSEQNSTFKMTYNMPTKYLGSLSYAYACSASGYNYDNIKRAVLTNTKDNFKYGEIIQYGENAVIEAYDEDDNFLFQISYKNFQSFIKSKSELYDLEINDTNNDKYNNQLLSNGALTLNTQIEFKTGVALKCSQTITISYADSLTIDTSAVETTVYIDDTFTDFDYTGITATITYINNEQNLSKQIEINYEDLSFSHDSVDTSLDEKVYNITVSTVYENRRVKTSFPITCIRIRPTYIASSGTDTTYFNNSKDTFHKPTNLNFYVYKNNDFNHENKIDIDIAELTFYRDANYSSELIAGTSIILKAEGNYIYYKHKGYNLTGSYLISFKEDNISNLELKENVEFILGNTYLYERNKFKIQATYESGNVADYDDYSFVNTNEVLKAETVYITANNTIYALDSSKITFAKPEILKVIKNLNSFQTSYNNLTDTIDITPIVLTICYEGTPYTTTANVYNADVLSNSKEYTVSCSDLGSSFKYDGSESINVNMEDQTTKKLTLTLTVLNAFDTSKTAFIAQDIQIVEINEIVGLSLVSAFRDYYVGQTFLNSDDDTEVLALYKDTSGTTQKLKIKLNSGFAGLNIEPIKGTKFYNTDDSKKVTVSSVANPQISISYTINVGAKYTYSDIKTHILNVVYCSKYICPNGEVINDKYLIVDNENTVVENKVRKLAIDKSISTIKVYGYLDYINDAANNAHVIFFEDYIAPVVGESNITVKYPCYVSGNADYINKCHFGHLFGNNNAKNRLFLSGNKDYANCDWHSGAINTSKTDGDILEENGNFTYFEDTSYCFYGQTDNEIVGYDIVSNDRMVVLKSKSDKEPTIYYRTSGLISAIDGSGNSQVGLNSETLYEESYPLVIGNIGAGAISNRSILNFNGDTLFISSDAEIDGLDVSGIIGDTQRYANTRSRYINPLFKNQELDKLQMFTNNKYLFVIFSDYILLTHFETYNSDTSQYEWWKISIKNVSFMIEINNQIYFGTTEGKLFKLTNGIYQDITKIFIGKSGSTLVSEGAQDNIVQVSDTVIEQLKGSSEYYFKILPTSTSDSSYMYYQIATINNVKSYNTDLYINKTYNCLEVVGLKNGITNYNRVTELLNLLSEKETYYLNHLEGENQINCDCFKPNCQFNYYTKFKLQLVEDILVGLGTCFYLINEATGEKVDISSLYNGALCLRLDKEYKITNINEEKAQFQLSNEYGILNLIRYADQEINQSFKAQIIKYSNIKAYYISAPFTMGNLMYNKTIWGWTLTNDTNIYSQIEVCQATNDTDFENMKGIIDLNKSDYGYSFSQVNFSSVSFDKFVIPHKYTFYRPINVSFICFGFQNNEATNAVLSSIQVIYTLPRGSNSKE